MPAKKIKQKQIAHQQSQKPSHQPDKHQYWHNLEPEKVAEILRSDLVLGLSQKEVAERQKFGLNKLPSGKPLTRLKIILNQFKSPLIYILAMAGGMTLFLKEWADSIVILLAVGLNAAVGYFQEYKASNTLNQLKKILELKAIVLRDGHEKEIAQEELVVGDIVFLKAGNKAPADGRIIESWNLKVNEASLTGEWLPAQKENIVLPEKTTLADRDNMVYMGTVIEEGEGKAIITAIGQHSEIGKVANLIREAKEEKTPYQKKLSRFSKIITAVISIVCIFIVVDGLITGRGFSEVFITAVAVAVAAIPEGLPIAMTVILALGMRRILKKKGLVRKLASAETLGSTSIIATDKTLTLTEGKMVLEEISSKSQTLALTIGCLANEAFIENPEDGPSKWRIVGGGMDKALIEGSADRGVLKTNLEKTWQKVEEIPFETAHKFVASLYKAKQKYRWHIKGAPEKILELSSKIQGKTRQQKITPKILADLEKQLADLSSRGLRVLAVAYKDSRKTPDAKQMKNWQKEIGDLIFVGFLALKDPVRKEAKSALALCQKAGIRPIILTGDHMLTAQAVARELNIKANKENVMLGEELDKLSDEELTKRLPQINVFARVEPAHKLKIITAWQAQDKVVAMTGDGINDAAALKKADIGVALGSGTDVAKEAADLVLLDDNFSVIVSAVEEGRVILDNIRKVITYLLSDSFTEVILIGLAILGKFPLPITAVQILWVNLLEDGLPNAALAFEPKEKDVMSQKPSNHHHPLLTREMKIIIFAIGLCTDIILFSLFLLLYKQMGPSQLSYIRTMIFVALTIDSLFYLFSCKSLRQNIWQINIFSNKWLVGAWLLSVAALIAGIYLPFLQKLLGTTSLRLIDWPILLGLGFFKLSLIEGIKYYFIRRKLV